MIQNPEVIKRTLINIYNILTSVYKGRILRKYTCYLLICTKKIVLFKTISLHFRSLSTSVDPPEKSSFRTISRLDEMYFTNLLERFAALRGRGGIRFPGGTWRGQQIPSQFFLGKPGSADLPPGHPHGEEGTRDKTRDPTWEV